jgi:hypothetical protein
MNNGMVDRSTGSYPHRSLERDAHEIESPQTHCTEIFEAVRPKVTVLLIVRTAPKPRENASTA